MIGNRRSDILNLIINHYIQTGEPMGSKTLCRLLPYAVSSATIRNEMAALGELGFLQQRHTSGGRIPTNASYRYYVDNLLVPKPLTPFEKQKITKEVLSGDSKYPPMAIFYLMSGNDISSDYARMYHKIDGKLVCHNKVHNLFGYNMTRAASEAFAKLVPDRRNLLFSRSSYIGMHRYGGIWTGDNKSWWSHILLCLKMLPGLNMCGFLYVGCDLGGFGENTTRDLLLRFLALGVFTPLMRNHSATRTREQEFYQFEDPQDFAAVIGVRYRLLPYLYSEYMKAALGDDLYFKPLAFTYPDDAVARQIEDQLMLGNEIMIAPVYTQNAAGRPVYLPEEMIFVKFLADGTILQEKWEKGWHFAEVALNEVPLFIRKDHKIPVVDVAEYVDAIDMTTLQYIGYTDADYELYTDDGITPIA